MSAITAAIVMGEDLESDGDDNAQGLAVSGEAPESDEEELDTASVSSVGSVALSPSCDAPLSHEPSVRKKPPDQSPRFGSLLHRKLRERNSSLRRSLTDLVSHALGEKEREVTAVSQALSKSHTQMQECLQVLRCLTGDLLRVQAKMDDFYDSPALLPEIEFAIQERGAAALPPS